MRVLARYGWISLLGDIPDNWKETKSIDGLIGSLEGAEFVAYPKHKTCLSTFQASWDIELETAIKLCRGDTQTCTLHTLVDVSSIKSRSIHQEW